MPSEVCLHGLIISQKTPRLSCNYRLFDVIGFIVNQTLAHVVTVFVLLATYVILGNEAALAIQDGLFFAISFVVLNLMPLLAKGWSIGGWVVRLNHDNRPRKPLRRILFYSARALTLILVVFPPWGSTFITIVTITVLLVVWMRWKRLLYQFV